MKRNRDRIAMREVPNGIDVTDLVQLKKGKAKNHWTVADPEYSTCKFFSVGGS